MPDGDAGIGGGPEKPAYRPAVILVGNEKGGSGKTTTALHIAFALLWRGYKVATIDLDTRQASMTRFMENRASFAEQQTNIPLTHHVKPEIPETEQAEDDNTLVDTARAELNKTMDGLKEFEIIVIDTPGSLTPLSRAGHELADILITPINESLFDIDVLAKIDAENRKIVAPSFYCQMAWEYNNRRVIDGKRAIDWIIMRNRRSHVHSRNRQDVTEILDKLVQRIGFRLVPGFSERVIFREHFLYGITILDIMALNAPDTPAASHRAALEEIEALINSLEIRKPCEPLDHRMIMEDLAQT
jgi:chromosome partitioning protein